MSAVQTQGAILEEGGYLKKKKKKKKAFKQNCLALGSGGIPSKAQVFAAASDVKNPDPYYCYIQV